MKKFGFLLATALVVAVVISFFVFPERIENLSEFTHLEANPPLVLEPLSDKIYHAMSPNIFTGWEKKHDTALIEKSIEAGGKGLAWVTISNPWFPTGKKSECVKGQRNFFDKGIRFPMEDVIEVLRAGQIPSIRMLPHDRCLTLDDDFYSMQKFIDGEFDSDLRAWAKDIKKIPSPVLLTFGVEVNGDWFPWNMMHNGGYQKTDYGDPNLYDGHERFRDAYRHIIDLFREEGVENATWFYHVNCIWPSEVNDPKSSVDGYYPGDDYIDWIAISCYGSQDPSNTYWWPMSETFDLAYMAIENSNIIGKDKPVALMEYGVTEDSRKVNWMRTFFQDVEKGRYPRLKAMSWWQSNFCLIYNDHSVGGCSRGTDIRMNSSPEALQVYRDFFAKDMFTGKAVFVPREQKKEE